MKHHADASLQQRDLTPLHSPMLCGKQQYGAKAHISERIENT
ncbi:MAG: hypothetical protein PHP57_03110 [Sideroxydans sp.]|nr:hypothetical protein [Sideroxydans sp.]